MKLARKLTLFLVLAMCVVMTLDAWVGIWRETRLLEADMRTDQRDTGLVLAWAIADLWEREGEARALALVDHATAPAGQMRYRWVVPDAPPGSPLAPHVQSLARADLERDAVIAPDAPGSDGTERLF